MRRRSKGRKLFPIKGPVNRIGAGSSDSTGERIMGVQSKVLPHPSQR